MLECQADICLVVRFEERPLDSNLEQCVWMPHLDLIIVDYMLFFGQLANSQGAEKDHCCASWNLPRQQFEFLRRLNGILVKFWKV